MKFVIEEKGWQLLAGAELLSFSALHGLQTGSWTGAVGFVAAAVSVNSMWKMLRRCKGQQFFMHSVSCLRFIGGPLIQIGSNFTAVLDSYRLRLVIHCPICFSIFYDRRFCDSARR